MNELTFDEFCQLPMLYMGGIAYETGAQRMYRNNDCGIQKEIITKRNAHTMEWHEGKAYYFVDGDQREFSTIDQWYVAYMEKVCGVRSIE